ncbi:MAG: response regulator transcription factor [Bacteroidales bacterium]|nr:response regulator transcription factor [Bacteroidales bacterium]
MQENKIRALIIEDEMYDRKLIEKILCTNYSDYINIVGSVDNAKDAITAIKKQRPELLFLDIELNGDRYGAFKILDTVKHDFKIIFVTAKSEQDDLLKAIKLSCIDYLIKPTKISDFEAPIKRVYEEINSATSSNGHKIEIFKHNVEVREVQEAKISLQAGFTYTPTAIKNIIRCEAQGNYTKFVYIENKNNLINGNLKSFEDRLSDYGFCRVNKSDLINLSHIKSFSRKNISWEVLMTDGTTIYISPNRKQSFMLQYNSLHLS